MPSHNARVNLTLPPETIAVLDRLGKTTGAGRATIIREWLIEGTPLFAEMAKAVELAAAKNTDALKVMGQVLRDAGSRANQLELEIQATRRAARRKKKE